MDRYKVYLRLKPVSDGETDISEIQNDTTVVIDPRLGTQKLPRLHQRALRYSFKKIFEPSCSQRDVFRRVVLPSVRDVLSGIPALVLVNGAPGSGKNYTILGTPQNAGILPRTLDVLFNSIPSNLQAMKFVFKPDGLNGYDIRPTEDAMIDRQDILIESGSRIGLEGSLIEGPQSAEQSAWIERSRWEWDQTKVANDLPEDCRVAVFIQFVEIYNFCVYDLLDEETPNAVETSRGQTWKNIRHDVSKCTYVFGAKEVEVENADEAIDVFLRGQSRKRAAYDRLNKESFGSHSIYTIKIVQAPLDEKTEDLHLEKDFIAVTQFSLVDLAGCDKTGTEGCLDYSSMCLRSCLTTLRENQMEGTCKKVPYRDSRLTHLFKSFFEGIGRVKMLVCVNPRAEDYVKTLEVMKFAETTEEIERQREQIKRKLSFVEPCPSPSRESDSETSSSPSVEDLYTTAFDIGTKQTQDDTLQRKMHGIRIQEELEASIEEEENSSKSTVELLNDEILGVASPSATQEEKYRRKSLALEKTALMLTQVVRERDHLEEKFMEAEARKAKAESLVSQLEESLRKVTKQKERLRMECETLRFEKQERLSSKASSSTVGKSSTDNTYSGITRSSERSSETGTGNSGRPPQRPRRSKQTRTSTDPSHAFNARAKFVVEEETGNPSSRETGSGVRDVLNESDYEEFYSLCGNTASAGARMSNDSRRRQVGQNETRERVVQNRY